MERVSHAGPWERLSLTGPWERLSHTGPWETLSHGCLSELYTFYNPASCRCPQFEAATIILPQLEQSTCFKS